MKQETQHARAANPLGAVVRLVTLVCASIVPFAQAPVAAQETVTVEPAGVVTWDDMQQAEPLAPVVRAVEPQAVPFMPGPTPLDIGPPPSSPSAQLPAPARQTLLAPGPIALPPLGPSLSTNFLALPDINTTIPPDTMGAVGPADVMTMLNSEVRIQNKVGGVISTVSLATFWTVGTGLVGSPFDPKLVYDSGSARWIATVEANANSATSQVWFAISATSSPTGAWTFYGFGADPAFPAGTTWADYPGFGVNPTWIAITSNMYTVAASPVFAGAKMWVIDKATALAGGPLTVTVFPAGFDVGFPGATLQPAVTFGASTTLYIVDTCSWVSGPNALVRISRITGTGPAPAWSVQPGSVFGAGAGLFIVVNNFDYAQIGAPQLGVAATCDGGTNNGLACTSNANCPPGLPTSSCRLINTNDCRMLNAVFRNSRIWATHSGGRPVGAVDRTAVFWYQLDPAAMPAPTVQSGVLDGGAGVHHFFPSITANASDDACIGFSRSDAARYAEGVFTSRFGTDAPGMMDPISVLKAGEDSYLKDYGTKRIRWGDYSSTVIDPTDDLTCWTVQEYAAFDVGVGTSDDRWGTWWGRLAIPTATPSATPTYTQPPTPTPTATPTHTATHTATPTATPTNTPPPTPTPTATLTLTASHTATPSLTPTGTATGSVTNTPTVTETASPAATPTQTPTLTPVQPPATCAATPVSGCTSPGKALLRIKDKDANGPSAGDKLVWKWLKGPATVQSDFGNPDTGATSYALCVYNSVPTVVMSATIPAGANWDPIGTVGYKYLDSAAGEEGIFKVTLKGGGAGKAKILFKGRDANLLMPSLPLNQSSTVTVQLVRSGGPQCWQAVYPSPALNSDGTQFKDKIP